VSVCGGGFLPHRYKRENGFDNPSVWCEDIQLILARMLDIIKLTECSNYDDPLDLLDRPVLQRNALELNKK